MNSGYIVVMRKKSVSADEFFPSIFKLWLVESKVWVWPTDTGGLLYTIMPKITFLATTSTYNNIVLKSAENVWRSR
jgi:hypothetical protein